MIDKTGSIPPHVPPHHHQPAKGKPSEGPEGAKQASHHEKGGTSKFLGMEVTEKQKKQIYANLSRQVITSIKHDQDRQIKALKNIRHASEGEPLEP